MIWTSGANAGDPETLTTLKGAHYEKVRITEVTPTTVTIVHSAGVCRIPIVEFPPEVRKRFGYDEAKAAAWISEQTRQAAVAAEAKQKAEAKNRIEAEKTYQDVLQQAQILSSAVYDPSSGQWHSSAEDAQAARQRALRNSMQLRYESAPRPTPHVSLASPAGPR